MQLIHRSAADHINGTTYNTKPTILIGLRIVSEKYELSRSSFIDEIPIFDEYTLIRVRYMGLYLKLRI